MTHSGVARARHCRASYCNKDIANEIHIACADPACANFELCLQVSVRLPKKSIISHRRRTWWYVMIRSLSASLCKSTAALNHRNLPLFACSYSVCVVSCRRYLISLLRLSVRIYVNLPTSPHLLLDAVLFCWPWRRHARKHAQLPGHWQHEVPAIPPWLGRRRRDAAAYSHGGQWLLQKLTIIKID